MPTEGFVLTSTMASIIVMSFYGIASLVVTYGISNTIVLEIP